jgi:hypothetical protein
VRKELGSPPLPWRPFDSKQIAALGRQAAAGIRIAERVCPVCGKAAIRNYRHPDERATGPTVISYVWCANCQHYAGSTGPRDPGEELADPLTREDHGRLDNNLRALLDHLDHLWDTGVLPP